ncbi:MAG: hypothetical protein ACFFDV_00860 [Candidatus Thorarchaeota archaeon]
MQEKGRSIVKVAVLVPLSILASIYFIGPGGIVSFSPATRASVHSLLTYWISVPAAIGIFAYIRKPLRAHLIMTSAFIFMMIINGGSAAKNLFILSEPTIEYTFTNGVLDIFEFTLIGFLFLASSLCYSRPQLIKQQRLTWAVIVGITLFPAAMYGLVWYVVSFLLPSSVLTILALFFGMAAAIFILISLYLSGKIKPQVLPIDLGYFASALLMIASSAIMIMMSLLSTTINWVLAESLQIASFLVLSLSLSVPFLKSVGFSRRYAYVLAIGLMLMAYLPFLFTIIIESLGPSIIESTLNILGFSIIHIGAASLAGMMAILLYLHSRRKVSWNYYPLILLFGLWSTLSVMQVFLVENPIYNEPLISFIVGSLLSLFLLLASIQWTIKQPKPEPPSYLLQKLAVVYSITVAFVFLGEFVNVLVVDTYPQLQNSAIGPTILLVTNLIIILALSFLIFILANQSRGRSSVDLFIVVFLAMWILPNILKSYYVYWSTGWWVSESLLFVGLLAGPPVLAWLYIQETHESEESRAKADLMADLLMHDITNYNQMILTSLELLSSSDLDDRQRNRVSRDGSRVISFAEQLINNVRLLTETERRKRLELYPTNLVSTIVSALDSFTQQGLSERVTIDFRPETDEAFVLANELLYHVFLNILYSALEYPLDERNIAVNIVHTLQGGTNWWETIVQVPGHWVRQGERFRMYNSETDIYSSNSLGLMAARILTESLRGQFSLRDASTTKNQIRTAFVIRLMETGSND